MARRRFVTQHLEHAGEEVTAGGIEQRLRAMRTHPQCELTARLLKFWCRIATEDGMEHRLQH